MSAGDWIIDFEAAVLEAIAGHRQFPVTFVLRGVPTAGELTEAAESVTQLDRAVELEVEYFPGDGANQDCLKVSCLEVD